MNPCHAPRVLRRSGTVSCAPGSHASIVDGAESLRRDLGATRNLRDRLRRGTDLPEACSIRGPPGLHAFVRGEGRIRAWVPPGHPSPPRCVPLALAVLPGGESAKILPGPIHCFLAGKKW